MDSVDRIQFLGIERWRLPLSSLLSLKALPMFLLIGISKPAMNWGVSLLVLWLSDPLLPPVSSSFAPPLHFLKNILSYLVICCVDVGKGKHTCWVYVWALQHLFSTQGVGLGTMSLIC